MSRIRGTVPQKPKPEPKQTEKPKELQFFEMYQMFLAECGEKNDIIGLKNSSIEKKPGYLRWFLNWATDRGYNINLAYKAMKPYIDIVDSIKASEMTKLNGLI